MGLPKGDGGFGSLPLGWQIIRDSTDSEEGVASEEPIPRKSCRKIGLD
ncbi:Protein CBG25475 [Caenorhabditis briggsae]|uniref:Protein CBG25475 n=1 Tax=Caenorhabditis briggsae TaxID=6238 RepID=B6IFI9_CAEBR|nr:Protein CBG25475 [Caenorhabditis briggsae]CAR98669.1 Protein CBG25475 [Caenorhabditis briggsae]